MNRSSIKKSLLLRAIKLEETETGKNIKRKLVRNWKTIRKDGR